MKITRSIKNIFTFAFCVLFFVFASVAFVSLPIFGAKAEVLTTTEMYADGASIRLVDDDTSGIRFHVRVKSDADGNVVTDGITLSDKSYNSVGWFTFTNCELATMTLDAGTYQISFTIAGDNMNYTGISVIANAPVALGKSE